jgi:hypothetical protein
MRYLTRDGCLDPTLRINCGTGTPTSAFFNTLTICFTENFFFGKPSSFDFAE